MTEWRAIPGYEGRYEVSDAGRVRSLDRVVQFVRHGRTICQRRKGVLLKPIIDPCSGYVRVTLYKGSKETMKPACVHVLVALAFIGPAPEGREVCHNDGKRDNPALSNLRYDTPRGNSADMALHGTRLFGEKQPKAKLTEAAVLEIIATPRGDTKRLAEKFGVNRVTIKRIRRGRGWNHVSGIRPSEAA